MAPLSGSFAAVLLLLVFASRVAVADRGESEGKKHGVGLPIEGGKDVSDFSQASSDPSVAGELGARASVPPSGDGPTGIPDDATTADDVEVSAAQSEDNTDGDDREDDGEVEEVTRVQAEADEAARFDAMADKDKAAAIENEVRAQAEKDEVASIADYDDEERDQAEADEAARMAEKETQLKAETDEAALIAADEAAKQTQIQDAADDAADDATLSPPPPLDVHTAGVLAATADKSAATAVADAKGWTGIATDVKKKAVDKLEDAKVAHQERIEARENHAKALEDKENTEMEQIHGDLAKLGVQ